MDEKRIDAREQDEDESVEAIENEFMHVDEPYQPPDMPNYAEILSPSSAQEQDQPDELSGFQFINLSSSQIPTTETGEVDKSESSMSNDEDIFYEADEDVNNENCNTGEVQNEMVLTDHGDTSDTSSKVERQIQTSDMVYNTLLVAEKAKAEGTAQLEEKFYAGLNEEVPLDNMHKSEEVPNETMQNDPVTGVEDGDENTTGAAKDEFDNFSGPITTTTINSNLLPVFDVTIDNGEEVSNEMMQNDLVTGVEDGGDDTAGAVKDGNDNFRDPFSAPTMNANAITVVDATMDKVEEVPNETKQNDLVPGSEGGDGDTPGVDSDDYDNFSDPSATTTINLNPLPVVDAIMDKGEEVSNEMMQNDLVTSVKGGDDDRGEHDNFSDPISSPTMNANVVPEVKTTMDKVNEVSKESMRTDPIPGDGDDDTPGVDGDEYDNFSDPFATTTINTNPLHVVDETMDNVEEISCEAMQNDLIAGVEDENVDATGDDRDEYDRFSDTFSTPTMDTNPLPVVDASMDKVEEVFESTMQNGLVPDGGDNDTVGPDRDECDNFSDPFSAPTMNANALPVVNATMGTETASQLEENDSGPSTFASYMPSDAAVRGEDLSVDLLGRSLPAHGTASLSNGVVPAVEPQAFEELLCFDGLPTTEASAMEEASPSSDPFALFDQNTGVTAMNIQDSTSLDQLNDTADPFGFLEVPAAVPSTGSMDLGGALGAAQQNNTPSAFMKTSGLEAEKCETHESFDQTDASEKFLPLPEDENAFGRDANASMVIENPCMLTENEDAKGNVFTDITTDVSEVDATTVAPDNSSGLVEETFDISSANEKELVSARPENNLQSTSTEILSFEPDMETGEVASHEQEENYPQQGNITSEEEQKGEFAAFNEGTAFDVATDHKGNLEEEDPGFQETLDCAAKSGASGYGEVVDSSESTPAQTSIIGNADAFSEFNTSGDADFGDFSSFEKNEAGDKETDEFGDFSRFNDPGINNSTKVEEGGHMDDDEFGDFGDGTGQSASDFGDFGDFEAAPATGHSERNLAPAQDDSFDSLIVPEYQHLEENINNALTSFAEKISHESFLPSFKSSIQPGKFEAPELNDKLDLLFATPMAIENEPKVTLNDLLRSSLKSAEGASENCLIKSESFAGTWDKFSMNMVKKVLEDKLKESVATGILHDRSNEYLEVSAAMNKDSIEELVGGFKRLQQILVEHATSSTLLKRAQDAALSAEAALLQQINSGSRGSSMFGFGSRSTIPDTIADKRDTDSASMRIMTPTGSANRGRSGFLGDGAISDTGSDTDGGGSDHCSTVSDAGTDDGDLRMSTPSIAPPANVGSSSSSGTSRGFMKRFTKFASLGSRSRHQVVQVRRNDATSEIVKAHIDLDKVSGGFEQIKWQCAHAVYDNEILLQIAPSQIRFFSHPDGKELKHKSSKSSMNHLFKANLVWSIDIQQQPHVKP